MAQALHGRRIGGAAVVGIQLPCAFGKAIAVLRQAGYPASVSHSAGTFVCNHVFYGLQHALAGQNSVRSGFMHLPYLPEQAARHAGARSLALGTMVDGVAAALAVALATEQDAKVSEGTLD